MNEIRQRKSADERRREIIETALRLAAEKGPENVTTEAIATAIGISQPGVFRHFSRKDDIWLAVFEWLQGAMRERWAAAEAAMPNGEQRLLAIVRAQLQLIESIPALPGILFTWQLHREASPLRDGIIGMMRRFHGRIAETVGTDLVDSGQAERAAWLVISIIQGTAIRWTLSRRRFNLPEEGTALVDLALRGLRSLAAGTDRRC